MRTGMSFRFVGSYDGIGASDDEVMGTPFWVSVPVD